MWRACNSLPRTGLPELFRTKAEYETYVDALVSAGLIENASFIWWAIRPSLVNPTLELRAPDSCTLVEDTIAIAALYRTVARHLSLNRSCNAGLNAVQRALVIENKWQAQRHGVNAVFVTEDGGITVADMLERTTEETVADAAALNCTAEIGRCRAIVGSGTSADAQLAVFDAHGAGKSRDAALRAVTEWISVATLQ